MGYTTTDPATGRILNSYVQPRVTKIQTGTTSTSGFTVGPVLTGITVGQTVSSMVLNAMYTGVNQNTATDIGGAFLYFS